MKKLNFPFTAILGQEKMKMALVLNVIDPQIGGENSFRLLFKLKKN
ncbi:MAG: hypothetical protein KGD63_07190 [Candidatus Lokiarchaeota archaeon]|nr:hypothetical protein [Candidatus Lokiarchaeota archaeon]